MIVRCTIHYHSTVIHHWLTSLRSARSNKYQSTNNSNSSLSSTNILFLQLILQTLCCCCWWYRLEYELEEEDYTLYNNPPTQPATIIKSDVPTIIDEAALSWSVFSAAFLVGVDHNSSQPINNNNIVPTHHWRRCIRRSVFASPLGEAAFIYYHYTAINLSCSSPL